MSPCRRSFDECWLPQTFLLRGLGELGKREVLFGDKRKKKKEELFGTVKGGSQGGREGGRMSWSKIFFFFGGGIFLSTQSYNHSYKRLTLFSTSVHFFFKLSV